MTARKVFHEITICVLSIMVFSFLAIAKEELPLNRTVKSQRFVDVSDNEWFNNIMEFEPERAGLYYVEITEGKGRIGFYLSTNPPNPYKDGMAWIDREPQKNDDFVNIAAYRPIGVQEDPIVEPPDTAGFGANKFDLKDWLTVGPAYNGLEVDAHGSGLSVYMTGILR